MKRMTTFGNRLKQARSTKKLTQNAVADKLGVDFTTISKYENNKSEPDNEILRELASLYEVSVDWLLTGSQNDKASVMNQMTVNGVTEILTFEEAQYLLESLEMYRLLKAKRERDIRKKAEASE